jgi:hypothetical protein
VLDWDDTEELTPGPELGQMALHLSRVVEFTAGLPVEVVALQQQIESSGPVLADLQKPGQS